MLFIFFLFLFLFRKFLTKKVRHILHKLYLNLIFSSAQAYVTLKITPTFHTSFRGRAIHSYNVRFDNIIRFPNPKFSHRAENYKRLQAPQQSSFSFLPQASWLAALPMSQSKRIHICHILCSLDIDNSVPKKNCRLSLR